SGKTTETWRRGRYYDERRVYKNETRVGSGISCDV
ncbi:unnamed protein product, partial [Allacma fusca]